MPVTRQQAALFAELRLAGASTFEAIEVLLAAQTYEKAIDLAKVWQTELRDTHGRFASRGAVTGGLTSGMRHGQRAARRAQLKAARNPVTHESVQQVAHREAAQQAVKIGARVAQGADKAAAEHAKQSMEKISHQIEAAQQHENQVEAKKSRMKFGAMAASVLAGAAGGYVESKLGMPDITQIITSVSPALAESFFEMKKRL